MSVVTSLQDLNFIIIIILFIIIFTYFYDVRLIPHIEALGNEGGYHSWWSDNYS